MLTELLFQASKAFLVGKLIQTLNENWRLKQEIKKLKFQIDNEVIWQAIDALEALEDEQQPFKLPKRERLPDWRTIRQNIERFAQWLAVLVTPAKDSVHVTTG